jgi:mannose-6-phosphate isomerase
MHCVGSPEFRLSRMELTGVSHPLDYRGPQILLVVDGVITATDAAGRALDVPRGRSLWIPAAEEGTSISGHGTVFRATDGLPTAGSVAA